MDLNDLEKIRVEKIDKLKELGIEPYPTRSYVNSTIRQACDAFEAAEKNGETDTTEYVLAGRMRSLRVMGKLAFTHIEDHTGKLQLFLRINEMGEKLKFFKEYFDLGDFVEARGTMMRTKAGELSLLLTDIRMLAKAVSPLPAAKEEMVDGQMVRHTGLSDPELRYRQRYADLVVNPEVKNIFRARAKVVSSIRRFLDEHDFLEVETPILQPIYGGAAARPFTTHHNQLKQDLFLRISFELYLKRLLVGGLDRVYEIGRDFRNEGVSYKHNPEFTQVEFYCAYFDYLKVMNFVEEMIRFVAEQTLGKTTFTYNGIDIDLSKPWNRVNMREGILKTTGIDYALYPDKESLAAAMREKGIEPRQGLARGKLIDQLVGDYLEPTFEQPTFLYDYPWEISPLAKRKPDDPTTTERFEGFIAGMELCNAFTELNDPIDQEVRFLEMGRSYDKDDDENNPIDEDYLQAMCYGMPPCGGFGMGVDRLTMLLTNSSTIREVLLFPHLRDRGYGEEERTEKKKDPCGRAQPRPRRHERMNTTNPIGILWDLDGTIIESLDLYFAAYTPLFEKYGLGEMAYPKDLYRKRYFGRGVEVFLSEYVQKEIPDTLMTAMKRDYLYFSDEILSHAEDAGVQLVPGVDRVLKKFHQAGFRMAIASTSWMPTIVHSLEKLGLLNLFDNLVSGTLLPSKPAPDVFLTAAASIGLPANRCVVFEDSLGGMRGAKNAGMCCVGIATSLEVDAMPDADIALARYADMTPERVIDLVNSRQA